MSAPPQINDPITALVEGVMWTGRVIGTDTQCVEARGNGDEDRNLGRLPWMLRFPLADEGRRWARGHLTEDDKQMQALRAAGALLK